VNASVAEKDILPQNAILYCPDLHIRNTSPSFDIAESHPILSILLKGIVLGAANKIDDLQSVDAII